MEKEKLHWKVRLGLQILMLVASVLLQDKLNDELQKEFNSLINKLSINGKSGLFSDE